MNRRDFLRALGIGVAAAAVPAVLVPERRIWQVSRNAPVGRRVASAREMQQHAGYIVTYGDGSKEAIGYEEAIRSGIVTRTAPRAFPKRSEPGWTFEPYEGPPVRNMYAELRRELQAPWDADLSAVGIDSETRKLWETPGAFSNGEGLTRARILAEVAKMWPESRVVDAHSPEFMEIVSELDKL